MGVEPQEQSEFARRLRDAERRHDDIELQVVDMRSDIAVMRKGVGELTDAVLRHVTRRQEFYRASLETGVDTGMDAGPHTI